jgi:hypothetical protein
MQTIKMYILEDNLMNLQKWRGSYWKTKSIEVDAFQFEPTLFSVKGRVKTYELGVDIFHSWNDAELEIARIKLEKGNLKQTKGVSKAIYQDEPELFL